MPMHSSHVVTVLHFAEPSSVAVLVVGSVQCAGYRTIKQRVINNQNWDIIASRERAKMRKKVIQTVDEALLTKKERHYWTR